MSRTGFNPFGIDVANNRIRTVEQLPPQSQGGTPVLYDAVVFTVDTPTITSNILADTEEWNGFSLYLLCTAVTGGTAPTVTVTVQYSPDGTNWINDATTHSFSAVGNKIVAIAGRHPYFRLSGTWVGDSGDTLTFSAWASGRP